MLIVCIGCRGGNTSVTGILPENGRRQSRQCSVQADASVQPEFATHGALEICSLHSPQSFQGLPAARQAITVYIY